MVLITGRLRRIIILTMTLTMVLGSVSSAFANMQTAVKAVPTRQKIVVDGEDVKFRAYNIGGYNYFMLRDIAYIFNGTKAQFEMGWDGSKCAINIETGKAYTGKGVGFNITTPQVTEKGYKSGATIYKNGKAVTLLGYVIQGNTYFKLKALEDTLDIRVEWDEASQTIILMSDKDAELPVITPEPVVEEKQEAEWNQFEGYVPEKVADEDIKPATASQEQKMREDMLVLINVARSKEGMGPLKLDNNLIAMAEYKVEDMKKENNLSHDGSYGSFTDLVKMYNLGNVYAGENLLSGGRYVDHMFNMWWNSPGHKANMMKPEYTKIGIGFASSDALSMGMTVVPKGLEEIASRIQYIPQTNTYYVSSRLYWGTQEFSC